MVRKTIESKIAGRSNVLVIEPEKDKKGYFYSICLYHQHVGIIQNPYRCIELCCDKYKKMYIKRFKQKGRKNER